MAARAKIGQTHHLQKLAELSKRVRFKICSEINPAIQSFGLSGKRANEGTFSESCSFHFRINPSE